MNTAPGPTIEGPVRKRFRGGTQRLIAPEETVARARAFMPVMGITRIANVTGLDRIGIPVVVVCRPNSRSLSVSQGKGLDLASAKASALMESIEAYHAERILAPLKLATYEELRYTHRVVDVTQLPITEMSLFHPHMPLLWIEGQDLIAGEGVWVPFELVHTNYTLPHPTGSGCFTPSSNGLASGNHVLEATSHALCEVVERDATTLWSLLDEDAQRATRVDLATVDDPGCREMLDRFAAAKIDAAVWETTSDIGIPAFISLITEREINRLNPMYSAAGMGCHPVRAVALMRALSEAAQSRLTVISGSRDDVFREDYSRIRTPDFLLEDRSLFEAESHPRRFADSPTFESETFDEDIAWELERLRQVGIERVAMIDLTRPDFRLPVVRVVIPGLEGPSSLMGWTPGPRARARMEAAR